MKKLLILNGPNLNFLGRREPSVYGASTLSELLDALRAEFAGQVELLDCQSNSEGALIDRLQQAVDERVDGIVFNAGAYTHTSVALADAIKSIEPIPVVEVHLSNVHRREAFRHHSFLSPVCRGVIAGFGFDSYRLAIRALLS